MTTTLTCNILFMGNMASAHNAKRENINSTRCIADGTNKKLKGGTTGKNLSASHTFHEITFAISQKKQINLTAVIFFEITGRL